MIGYAFCGSFCTVSRSIDVLDSLLSEGIEIQPILSENVYNTDTRFGKASDIRKRIESMCARPVIHTITEAEPIGPKEMFDMLVIAPCTGNTLAKVASGITDTSVTMAAKSHLRTGRPLVIALATNDAISSNLQNIAKLVSKKNIYFVPLYQDDTEKKPNSLVCDFGELKNTMEAAYEEKQIQPIFKSK